MGTYYSTKCFDHNLGLSACFRQWRANSHCRFLHGYALAFTFVFACKDLDDKNWCVDFGGLKELKEYLIDTFDHKMIVAEDDPHKDEITALAGIGVADCLVLPAVGCEAFAQWMFTVAETLVMQKYPDNRVYVVSCECREHSGNSAIYSVEDEWK